MPVTVCMLLGEAYWGIEEAACLLRKCDEICSQKLYACVVYEK